MKAIAVKEGMENSYVIKASYVIKTQDPSFSLNEGSYKEGKKLTINCETKDAVIRYTTDGSIPTKNSPIYSAPINIMGNITVKTIVISPAYGASNVISENYRIRSVIGDVSGDGNGVINATDLLYVSKYIAHSISYFPSEITPRNLTLKLITDNGVTMSWEVPLLETNITGYQIFRNDTLLTSVWNSTSYIDSSISPYTNYTYKIKAIISSDTYSNYSNSAQVLANTVAIPYFSVVIEIPVGTDIIKNVALSCATPGATIVYTTDGTEPTSSSTVYSDVITINQNMTIKAKAIKNGMTDSAVVNFR